MTRRSQPPPYTPPTPGPGRLGGRRDPFRQFERVARDNGKPYQPPEPKAELLLLAWLSSKAALRVMMGLLAAVVVALLVVLVVKL